MNVLQNWIESGNPLDILENSGAWIQMIDPEGNLVYVNKYAGDFTGYSKIDLSGDHNFWEFLFKNEETGLRLRNICCSLLKSNKGFKGKIFDVVSKSGEIKKVSWSMNPFKTAGGKPGGAILVGTEQPGFVKNIFDSPIDEKYRNIFRKAPIGFFRSLPEGRFIEINEAFATLLGYKNPEEVLKSVTDIAKQIYFVPEFRKEVVSMAVAFGAVKTIETVFKTKQGEPIDVRLNISSRQDAELDLIVLEGTVENITDRKVAERELHKNLLKYSTLFRNSPISLWEMDYSELKTEVEKLKLTCQNLEEYFRNNPDQLTRFRSYLKVLDVNSSSVELFEAKDKDDLIARCMALRSEFSVETEIKSILAVAENRDSFHHESIYNTLKSKRKNVIVRWVLAPDAIKPYSRVLISMVDITAQKAEQEALDESKSQLASLFNSLDDLVFILNQEGRYEYVAPTRPELLISEAESLKGKYLRDFLEPKLASYFVDQINKCINEKRTLGVEYPLLISGKVFWFEAKLSPLTDTTVIAVSRDISERVTGKKVDEVLLNVAKAVSVTDEPEELFELIRKEISKLIDTKNFFLALFDPETNSLSLPYFLDENDSFDHFPAENTLSALVIQQKKSMLLNEPEIMKLADEGKINIVGTVAKIWLGIPLIIEGEVLGLMVVQDYNDENAIIEEHRQLLEVLSPQISLSIKRKQSEQLLRKSEHELRESNLTKDRFFNIIAHDLKNPFNAIIGFSTLLGDEWNEFDDNDKISMVNSIKSSSQGAYELLMNLLEWSRLHVGKIEYDPQFIDFTSLIRINFSLLKTAADKKGIRLQSVGNCDKMVWADPNMIKTVIRNLISNAIKFTPENGLISVECLKDVKHQGMMVLAISDSGVGISPEEIGELFSLAKNGSTSGTNGESGTGLGLIICKEFVEKNKGKIWVESQSGKGSTFFVALPVRPT